MLTKREYFDKFTTGAKLDYPELMDQINDLIEEMLSQCAIENEPTDADLWDAEKQLYDLIERNPKYTHVAPMPETWYEQNL